ncbi:BNR repeat protein [Arcicella aurantiaca]|uniref:BNR repeat protein n=1 Tax=Arcicella aurantiaca TaxID=591202 RepID=A0A316E052_9BACT|nr:sialidase family protein [Arcicella aurantiaca]PWK23366.1 BNR repeat protein [Arcicella aurantiaca]
MKYLIITVLSVLLGLEQSNKITQISDSQNVGVTPRFTKDVNGNPVLSWVEKEGDKVNRFFFAILKDGGATFSEKIMVKVPETISTHAEGMPKIAFKKNGEIIASFEMSKPTPTERFAGNLYYVVSKDNGKTWTEPQTVHTDVTAGKSHSFNDITTLPDGQVGFVWLDEKLGKYTGRSVKFRQTLSDGTLSPEVVVDSNACQCCRTNLFVDADKNLHILYRDMLVDGSRDISHVISKDGGKSFTDAKVIFDDKWKVNACPHTGPSITQVGKDLYTTWFTGKENEAGVRLTKLGSGKLIDNIQTNRAKHPQISNLNDNLVLVWEQSMQKDDTFFTKIGLKIFGKDRLKQEWLTPDGMVCNYPVVMAVGEDLLIAYEQKKDIQSNSTIIFQRISTVAK